MDACFLSVCLQLVKKPPGENNIEHSKNMHSRYSERNTMKVAIMAPTWQTNRYVLTRLI